MADWQPKFPDISRDLRDRKLSDAERVDDEANPDWVSAPDTSHLDSFRFDDARQSKILRIGGFSYIRVRFKTKGGGTTRYTYSFSDFNAAADWWGKLSTAAHPGQIINQMIAAGIPYERDY